MGRKTKSQKILASYRRKIKMLEKGLVSSYPQKATVEPIKKPSFPVSSMSKKNEKTTMKVQTEKNKEDFSLSKYFFADLKKSLLISFIAVAIEISLYFVRIYR